MLPLPLLLLMAALLLPTTTMAVAEEGQALLVPSVEKANTFLRCVLTLDGEEEIQDLHHTYILKMETPENPTAYHPPYI